MDVFIVDAAGQLGRELSTRANAGGDNTVATDRNQLDITSEASATAPVAEIKRIAIVNATAAIDRAETDAAVNRCGPLYLTRACAKTDIVLLHAFTDYVFDGQKHAQYLEIDTPNPQGVYCQSKREGEIPILTRLEKQPSLTVASAFSVTNNRFVCTILRLAKGHNELSTVADQTDLPMWIGGIAKVLLKVVDSIYLRNPLLWRPCHYARNHLACLYRNYFHRIHALVGTLDKKNAI